MFDAAICGCEVLPQFVDADRHITITCMKACAYVEQGGDQHIEDMLAMSGAKMLAGRRSAH